MANKLGSLLIQIAADTALLQRDMGKAVGIVNTGAKRMGDSITSAKRLLGGFVSFVAITRGVEAIITASAESEAAMAQLEARIKSTGGVAGLSAKGISDFADQLQRTTTFDDEAITQAATRLLSFQNLRGDVFLEATRSALDLSQALGKDLSASAAIVGKALNDPIKGIALLTRQGVTYTAQQKALINSLVETGDAAGAQRVHLAALSTAFGGAAEAARNTLGGALKALKNTAGNLIENDGEGLPALTKAINDFNDSLSDPAVKKSIDDFSTAIIGGLAWVVDKGPEVAANLETVAQSVVNLGKAFIIFKAAAFGGARGGPIGAALLGSLAAMELFKGEVGRFIADPRIKALQDLNAESEGDKAAKMRASLGIPEGGLKGPDGLQVKIASPRQKVAFSRPDLGPTAEQTNRAKAAADAASSAEKSRLASIKSVIDGLKEQQATIGKSESALVAYKLQIMGATKAQVDFAVSLSQANAIQEIIDALEKEGAALGLTGAALVEHQLRLQGASQAQIEFAAAISRTNAAKQNDLDIIEKEKAAREGMSEKIRQIKDEAITGLMDEVTAIRVAEGLKVEAVIAGVQERIITEQEAAGIIANVHKKAGEDVSEALKKTTDGIGEFALEAARGIQNTLGDQLFNIMKGKFENIGDSFKAMLDRMVADVLAAQLAKKMFGDFDQTGKIGGWASKLIPLAMSFIPGGGSAAAGSSAAASSYAFDTAAFNPSMLLKRERGGPVQAGRPYLVGEREFEIFMPESGPPQLVGINEAEIFRPKISGTIVPQKDFAKVGAKKIAGMIRGGSMTPELRDSLTQMGVINRRNSKSASGPGVIGGSGAVVFTPKVAGTIIPQLGDVFRERGGRVVAGRSYVAGERRPERFVPDLGEQEESRSAMGGVTLNMNISGITDARGIREASAQIAARTGASVQRALDRNR